MTVTQQESDTVRTERARRQRINTPLPATRGVKAVVWYGTNAKGEPKSGPGRGDTPLELEDVPGFVTHCLTDGWPTLAVYHGVMPLGGIERNPRRLWLTTEAVK